MSTPNDDVLSLLNEASFSINVRGAGDDSQFYGDLPDPVKDAVDSIARSVLDPESGHSMIVGASSSGKTFLIEQFAGNIDQYLENSALNNLQLIEISRADANKIEAMPNGIPLYLKACCKALQVKQENICLITESPDFAAAVYAFSKDIKLILEMNSSTHRTLSQRENSGASKIWSSWGLVDTGEIYLTRDELVASMSLVMIPKVLHSYNVAITDQDIDHLIDHVLDSVPSVFFAPEAETEEEARELEQVDAYGRFVISPGFWGLAIRKLASALAYSSKKSLLNENGEKDVCLYIDHIMGELEDEIMKITDSSASVFGMDLPFELPEGVNVSFVHLGQMEEEALQEEESYDMAPLQFSEIDSLEQRLKRTVIGQDHAISSVVDAMTVPAAGLNDSNKPVRSFMFLGPTGVGKTQLALSMAEQIALEPLNVIRLDMSEYSQPHEAAKLLGSPSGYVGYEDGGVLTNAVFDNPRSLIILDEVEKAHFKIWDSFLQIFDAGRMTDNKGRLIDFTRCIIVMTSNLGAKSSVSNLGFNGSESSEEKARKAFTKEVEAFFRPEFINRIDDFVFFNQLSIETARKIVRREISLVSERMAPQGFKLSKFEDTVVDEIIKLSSFSKYGARDIQRAVFKNVSQPLAKRMLSKTKKRKSIKLSLNGENRIQVS